MNEKLIKGSLVSLETLPMAPAQTSPASDQGKDPSSLPSLEQSFVKGSVKTPAGDLPQISSALEWEDRWGTIKARWGVGRMDYKVEPGLYAIGEPDEKAKVFVTANYKMSFDHLRQALKGRDGWILVLETYGINVWCAAGKGSFGTEELINRIKWTRLSQVVNHREVILPQLAGPGVAAHLVKRFSGFKVIYGPIKAADTPAFLDTGLKATPEMRRKTFSTWERFVLIPVELVEAIKWFLIIIPIFFFLGGLGGPAGFWANVLDHGLLAAFALLSALAAGAVLTPLLLPWLPGRAFSLKAMSLGLVAAVVLAFFRPEAFHTWQGRFELASWFFMIPAISAYLGMNFTGASTYTSLSGVKKEMRWAVPMEIGAGTLGIFLWVGSRFMA